MPIQAGSVQTVVARDLRGRFSRGEPPINFHAFDVLASMTLSAHGLIEGPETEHKVNS